MRWMTRTIIEVHLYTAGILVWKSGAVLKIVFSRIFREPHAYLSRGSHVIKISLNLLAQNKYFGELRKKTFAGSHVGTPGAFVMDNLHMDL